jgi:hypothetical protein
VAVPAARGAAVLRVGASTSLLAVVPFEGKLRATRDDDDDILLVNERGELFGIGFRFVTSAGTAPARRTATSARMREDLHPRACNLSKDHGDA